MTSLFLYFAAAAIVWAGLALYSWRVAEAALPQSEDFVQVDWQSQVAATV